MSRITDERLEELIKLRVCKWGIDPETDSVLAFRELQALRKLIADHNEDVESQCKGRGEAHCAPYVNRGRNCPDCPCDNRITVES